MYSNPTGYHAAATAAARAAARAAAAAAAQVDTLPPDSRARKLAALQADRLRRAAHTAQRQARKAAAMAYS